MILCIFMSVGVFSLTFVILQFFLFYLSLTKGLSILFIFLENSFLLIFSIILLVCFFYFGCDLYYCLPSANCRLNLFFSSLLCYSYIVCDLKIFSLFFFFLFFLGPHPWHMKFPRLGVQSELQLPAYATATAMWDHSRVFDLHHSSRQRWILNPLSEARDHTSILMVPSWICFHCATTGTP